MAAVILEKLAGQLREERVAHDRSGQERDDLLLRLRALCPQPPPRLDRAMGALTEEDTDANWCALVEALYAEQDGLGPDFDRLLTLVRIALRSRLDRVLVFAR
jgi:hypothetical protein